ncbi:MAG: peptide deformylase [Candidatus Pacebacteria bacterium]|nr:peptide deformylase [Candidatus Paceibacterota bacterium]
MKLKIITLPNELLRQKSKPIAEIDGRIKRLIGAMTSLLRGNAGPDRTGEGLSAIQVGRPVRLFLAHLAPQKGLKVFINPEIIRSSKKFCREPAWLEGCLSIPNLYARIKRPEWVILKYQDISGRWQKKRLTGFNGTVIQHEYDHLEGTLFIDHALKQKAKLYESRTTPEGKQLFETQL